MVASETSLIAAATPGLIPVGIDAIDTLIGGDHDVKMKAHDIIGEFGRARGVVSEVSRSSPWSGASSCRLCARRQNMAQLALIPCAVTPSLTFLQCRKGVQSKETVPWRCQY
jgi:hypothetical protein